MRAPIEGERLTAKDGTVWLVESVDTDEGELIVDLVSADDADDMEAMGFNLLGDEFTAFCKEHGITLT